MEKIGRFTVSMMISIGGIIYGAFAFSVMWEWFVVSSFGIAPIGLPAAIGIAATVQFLTQRFNKSMIEETPDLAFSASKAVTLPSMLLLIGWIATLFQ